MHPIHYLHPRMHPSLEDSPCCCSPGCDTSAAISGKEYRKRRSPEGDAVFFPKWIPWCVQVPLQQRQLWSINLTVVMIVTRIYSGFHLGEVQSARKHCYDEHSMGLCLHELRSEYHQGIHACFSVFIVCKHFHQFRRVFSPQTSTIMRRVSQQIMGDWSARRFFYSSSAHR